MMFIYLFRFFTIQKCSYKIYRLSVLQSLVLFIIVPIIKEFIITVIIIISSSSTIIIIILHCAVNLLGFSCLFPTNGILGNFSFLKSKGSKPFIDTLVNHTQDAQSNVSWPVRCLLYKRVRKKPFVSEILIIFIKETKIILL